MHVQSCCFVLLTNCFFDFLQRLLSLSYYLLCVHLTRDKITKHVVPWSLDIPWWKQACSSEYRQNAETKLPSNGGVPSTRRRHIINCAWSHNAPTVGYETWIMNHASCFTRKTVIETGVYHTFSFFLRASLAASLPFMDSVSFRLMLSREQNICFWVYFKVISWLLFLHLGFVFPCFISLLVFFLLSIFMFIYSSKILSVEENEQGGSVCIIRSMSFWTLSKAVSIT